MTALVLGGTYPHKHLIKLLKQRGYHVILADYLDNPPAREDADEFIRESTLDKEKILQVAADRKVDLVITTCIDQANVTACYVAEKLGLPRPYSYETALNVTDKTRMKKIMAAAGIPTPKYIVVEKAEEALNVELTYPLVIKPADSNSSKGVYKCRDERELLEHFPETHAASRNGKVIVEEYIDGTEISYYCVVSETEVVGVNSNRKILFTPETKSILQCGAGIYPADLSKELDAVIRDCVRKIMSAFRLSNTPLFVQVIVTKDEQTHVLEFAPRVPGGLSFRVFETANRFDMIDATIDSFLGIVSTPAIVQSDQYSAVMNVYCCEAMMGTFADIKPFIEKGIAKEFHPYKALGDQLPHGLTAGGRACSFLLQAQCVEEIKDKIRFINQNFEVYDPNGAAIMQHDIYDI
ncbi:MAG: ATP-grasp domain-containing protein [Selenomonadaceae bacterium]|nr:ATP-grasp domain-containing protein [Selenomonadaceae bacterium]